MQVADKIVLRSVESLLPYARNARPDATPRSRDRRQDASAPAAVGNRVLSPSTLKRPF
jgi:hypothetical protein